MEGISIYTLSPDLARVVEGVLVGHSDASIQADGTICFSPLHNVQAQHLEHHTGIRAKGTQCLTITYSSGGRAPLRMSSC